MLPRAVLGCDLKFKMLFGYIIIYRMSVALDKGATMKMEKENTDGVADAKT